MLRVRHSHASPDPGAAQVLPLEDRLDDAFLVGRQNLARIDECRAISRITPSLVTASTCERMAVVATKSENFMTAAGLGKGRAEGEGLLFGPATRLDVLVVANLLLVLTELLLEFLDGPVDAPPELGGGLMTHHVVNMLSGGHDLDCRQ